MKNCFLIPLLLILLPLYGQKVTGRIIDASTNESVPYANVYLKSHSVGVTAFRDGSFSLQFDTVYGDSLIISCIGYESQSFFFPKVDFSKPLKIALLPSSELLMEAEVLPRKMITITQGLDKRRAKYCSGSPLNHPYARYIKNEKQAQGFLRSVSVYVCSEGVYDAPFRLNLLEVSMADNSPADPLLANDFILQASEGNEWVTLNLEDKLIPMPLNGFFVMVEALPIDSGQILIYEKRFPELSEGWIEISAPKFGKRFENFSVASSRNWSYGWKGEKNWRPYWKDYFKEKEYTPTWFSRVSSIMIKAEIDYYADQPLKVKELKTKRQLKKVFDIPADDQQKYPQSSPEELLTSLKKAIKEDDLAYAFTHLLYYDDKDELQETMDQIERLSENSNVAVLPSELKTEVLLFLEGIQENLNGLHPSANDRFQYLLKYDGQMYYFQQKKGLWKISPQSTRLIQFDDFHPGYKP